MISLSAVIITFNEEKNIARCIDSLSEVADEILVVDSYSTDCTKEICQQKGVRFIENPFEGHIQQKNIAMGYAKYDIILSLDADEALSETLKNSILEVKKNWSADGYFLNRLTNYCGKWIYHCGWYPDKKLRLWDRRKGNWGGENPHDKVIPQNESILKNIKGDILHYSYYSVNQNVLQVVKFAEIAALEAVKKQKKINFFVHILLNPPFTFFKKYFLQLGFLDGYYGFVICYISAFARFLKYVNIWEMKRKKQ